MKLAALSLIGSAAAFAPAQTGKASTALQANFFDSPRALPFGSAPDTLDGSLVGDVGFDPIGFSTAPFASFNNPLYKEGDFMTDLQWLREAELTHGRIAQLAVVGFIWPALFGTFPGNENFGGAGYPQRYAHAAFISRYGMLGRGKKKRKSEKEGKRKNLAKVMAHSVAKQVAERSGGKEGDVGIQVGKTIVFLRQQAYDTKQGSSLGLVGLSMPPAMVGIAPDNTRVSWRRLLERD